MYILIFGAGSFIGNHYCKALKDRGHKVVVIDATKVKPKEIDFTGIDTVINVAGIAHIDITPDMEELFYRVNTDLAVDLCHEAKEHGVKQYVYMSSMNVFGDTTERIYSRKQENPKSFYGRSKWLADKRIHELENEKFKVASVRPPVVYGKGCKGNFTVLLKLSKFLFIFPSFKNIKSMIYIDNLCNFMCELVENGNGGYFHPQNTEYTSITEIVTEIRMAMGKKTIIIGGFEWLIKILMKVSHKIERAFANDYYDVDFSRYNANTYCTINFKESIKKSL